MRRAMFESLKIITFAAAVAILAMAVFGVAAVGLAVCALCAIFSGWTCRQSLRNAVCTDPKTVVIEGRCHEVPVGRDRPGSGRAPYL